MLLALLSLVALTRAAVVRVVEDAACGDRLDVRALVAGWTPPLDIVVASRLAPDTPLTTLYREAEAAVVDGALVTLECGSGRVLVHFSDFDVQLGCAIERVAALMAAVDALDDAHSFAVKARHVLDDVGSWHARRACALPSDLVRAAIFWVLVHALSYCVYARCCRRRAAAPT